MFGSSSNADGQNFESPDDWIDVNPNDDSDIEIDPSPIGPMGGTGHLSASSGSSTEGISGGANGSFGVQSRTRGPELLALAGLASSTVDGLSNDSGEAKHGFLYRDEYTVPIPGGTSKTTLVYTSGWRGDGDSNGDADGNMAVGLSLATDGSPNASKVGLGTVDGNGKSKGDDIIYLSYNGHNVSQFGDASQDPFGDYASEIMSKSIVFRSQNNGKTDGISDGDASEDSTSASIDSDLDGKGNSLLVIQDSRRLSDGSNPSMAPDLPHMAVRDNWNAFAIIKGKFSVDGDVTGDRSDGGPIGWSINANMADDLDAKYNSKQTYTGFGISAGGIVTGDYVFNRTAKFEAARNSSASAVGGGDISPVAGGDAGQATASSSNVRTGDTQVIIVITGNEAGIGLFPLDKTSLELELEALFAYSPPNAGGGESGSGSGDTSGGGAASYGSGASGGGSVVLAGTFGFFKGLGQGVCNLVNGVQDAAVGVANLAIAIPNTVAGGIDYATGATDPHYQMRIPYIPSPDWSRNLVTEESGTPGGWDDSHGWSKFFAGEGAMALLTGGASKAASAVDEAGLCANWFAKFVKGGCFVSGTLVTLSDLPRDQAAHNALWSDPVWHGTPYRDSSPESRDTTLSKTATIASLLASPRRMLVPIEQVPLGARVPTMNPRPWEYDDSLPDPVQADWGLIAMTMVRDDGGIVDAELIRPWAWIRSHRIETGKPLPVNIPELQVTGVAMVTSIGECPAGWQLLAANDLQRSRNGHFRRRMSGNCRWRWQRHHSSLFNARGTRDSPRRDTRLRWNYRNNRRHPNSPNLVGRSQ